MLFEESLLFRPHRYPQGNWSPDEFAFEDVFFDSHDGTRLHGWYIPHEHPRAAVLFCNGREGNLTWQIHFLKRLHYDLELSLLTFDYRGYGRSGGRPTEKAITADARAARDVLASRAGVRADAVVVLGASLGGAVAVDLAASQYTKAIILVSAFTSLTDMITMRYPILPARLLFRSRLDSLSKIGRCTAPLFHCHGTADPVVPYSMGMRLFDAANEPKRHLSLKGWNHDTPPPDEFFRAAADWLDSYA